VASVCQIGSKSRGMWPLAVAKLHESSVLHCLETLKSDPELA